VAEGGPGAAAAKRLLDPSLCAFCGRMDGSCGSFLRKSSNNKSFVCTSTCSDAPRAAKKELWDVGLTVGAVSKWSINQPCTNLPMECEVCPGNQFIWKYNMDTHITRVHGGVDAADRGGTTPQFREKFAISERERKDTLALLDLPWNRRAPKRRSAADNPEHGGARARTSHHGHAGGGGSSSTGTSTAVVAETRV